MNIIEAPTGIDLDRLIPPCTGLLVRRRKDGSWGGSTTISNTYLRHRSISCTGATFEEMLEDLIRNLCGEGIGESAVRPEEDRASDE